jgi:hypothetical protein
MWLGCMRWATGCFARLFQAFQILLFGGKFEIHRVCPSLVHPLESRLECYWAGGVAVRLISIAA